MRLSSVWTRVRDRSESRRERRRQKAVRLGDVHARVTRTRSGAQNAEFMKGGSSTN